MKKDNIIILAEETNTNSYIAFNTETNTFETESEEMLNLDFAIERYSDIVNGQYSEIDEVFYFDENLTKAINILLKN